MTDTNSAIPNAMSSADQASAAPPAKPKRRGRGLLLLLALVVIIGAGGSIAYKIRGLLHRPSAPMTAAAPAPAPTPVQVAQPRPAVASSAPPRVAPAPATSTGSATATSATPQPAPPPSASANETGAASAVPTNPDAAKITAMQAQIAQLSATVIADHADMVRLQASAASLPHLAAQAQTMAVLATASMALQSGQPLGTIPNAPEALVRYASVAPPTEAGLRAEFLALAPHAAQQAGMTNSGVTGLWARLRAHVVDLISLRRGDQVLIGSRADGTIAMARRDLALGDLTGAVAAVKTLPAPAERVMQPWLARADHLLAARAALTQMAEQH
ncbi:MAG TPA: hypothetical protein PK677_02285 [Acidiphilium sp.]|nr:hypothetical protein [Acidiphilium sp.]HQU24590.1 hypothetical protein [Acidiphilium sp.]